MFLNTVSKFAVFINLFFLLVMAFNCSNLKNRLNLKFYLWKSQQRSLAEKLFVDNVENFEACVELARKYRGLAFNFSPGINILKKFNVPDAKTFRDHYWNQPHLYFNCHILRCPENLTFKTMINDTSFDYFSLYEKPMDPQDYICLPEIGLFKLHTNPDTYYNASINCRHSMQNCGTLAHVASQKRTEALTRLIIDYNEEQALSVKTTVYLAYVGLYYNQTWSNSFEFFNSERENLQCFAYRAWEAGNPKRSLPYANASCVALTVNRTWRTVKCDIKLPYICEILTSCENEVQEM